MKTLIELSITILTIAIFIIHIIIWYKFLKFILKGGADEQRRSCTKTLFRHE